MATIAFVMCIGLLGRRTSCDYCVAMCYGCFVIAVIVAVELLCLAVIVL